MGDIIEVDESLSIEQKHRKEKKELQAQIQALKKAAKNDKSKRKELNQEIIQLENDLEEKHKKEIENFKNIENIEENQDNEEESEYNNVIPKVSKAQKRRDKKNQQERDREAEIKLQEKENINGPRNLENQAIHARLKERNLKLFSIPSDGDCLYNAVMHQLEIKYEKKVTVNELRNNVATYILENRDDFIPFLSNPDTYEMLTDNEFQEYCEKIKSTKVWGGQLEIRALSNCLKCPIIIIQATGPEAIEQGTDFSGPPLIICYHRHMYSLGEHYNSTQILGDNCDT